MQIGALTLFAFSSENWGRPRDEVMSLMSLFVESLEAEIAELHRNGVRVRFIGERAELDARLRASMASSEQITAANTRLSLQIALSYGGRSDIVARRAPAGGSRSSAMQLVGRRRSMSRTSPRRWRSADMPDPDLFIRTGGEQRISNFLLWNLAYTELYFTDRLWPDFDVAGVRGRAAALRRPAAALRPDAPSSSQAARRRAA